MKRLFLIHGDPRSGKSSLARTLKDKYFFEMLSLDELYVKFIETKCQEFYFERLRNYISPHYHYILDANGYTKDKFGRDLVKEWHEYLFATVSEESARHDDLIVEGYLLVDCHGELETRMSVSAQVFVIHASNGAYLFLGAPLTVKDIAELGQTDEHNAGKQGGDKSA